MEDEDIVAPFIFNFVELLYSFYWCELRVTATFKSPIQVFSIRNKLFVPPVIQRHGSEYLDCHTIKCEFDVLKSGIDIVNFDSRRKSIHLSNFITCLFLHSVALKLTKWTWKYQFHRLKKLFVWCAITFYVGFHIINHKRHVFRHIRVSPLSVDCSLRCMRLSWSRAKVLEIKILVSVSR